MTKDLNDRAREGSLPDDPASETRRIVRAAPVRAVTHADVQDVAPKDIAAEKSICASLLWAATYAPGTARLSTIGDLVRPDMFYVQEHAAIIAAIGRLEDQGAVADTVAVRSESARKRAEVPVEYLDVLVEHARVPSDIKLRQWAEFVRDAWLRRELISAAEKFTCNARSGTLRASECIERAASAVNALSQTAATDASLVSLKSTSAELVRGLGSDDSSAEFMTTGWRDLDRAIGGLFFEDVSLLAARTSIGKSAAATDWSMRIAEAYPNIGVLYATLEMPAKQFTMRLTASRAEVDLAKIRRKTMSIEEKLRVQKAAEEIAKCEIHFADSNVQTCQSISAIAQRYQNVLAGKGKRLGLVVIDHVHLIKPDRENEMSDRRTQMAAITRWMISLARTMKCHVLALAQVARSAETQGKDTRPQLHQIHESTTFEQDANNVFMLHRRRRRDGSFVDEPATLIIAKARNDATCSIRIGVEARFMRFCDIDNQYRDEPPSRQHVDGYFERED